jgi:subtilisin family serine protease
LTTICAPGSNIYNCFPNNSYKVSDGTSMASPVVAGAVALMKSVSPNLSNSQIIQILKSTGKPIGNGNAGSLIQIDKAVAAAKSMGHN